MGLEGLTMDKEKFAAELARITQIAFSEVSKHDKLLAYFRVDGMLTFAKMLDANKDISNVIASLELVLDLLDDKI